MAEFIEVTLEGGKYTMRERLGHWEILRYGEPWPAFANKQPDNLHMALAHEVDALRKQSEPVTVEQAREIWDDRSNGGCDGMSPSKGGRAWLTGEFQLCELEALCIILRDLAGKDAEGAAELLAVQKAMGA